MSNVPDISPTSELLDCPFCQRVAVSYGDGSVGCGAYYCPGKVMVHRDAWNTRPSASSVMEVLDKDIIDAIQVAHTYWCNQCADPIMNEEEDSPYWKLMQRIEKQRARV